MKEKVQSTAKNCSGRDKGKLKKKANDKHVALTSEAEVESIMSGGTFLKKP